MKSLAHSRPRATSLFKAHQYAAVAPHKQRLPKQSRRVVRVSALDDAFEAVEPATEPAVSAPPLESAVPTVTEAPVAPAPPAAPELPELSAAQRLYQEQAARSFKAAAGNASESTGSQGVELPELPDLGAAAANLGDSASKAVDNVTGVASKAAEGLTSAVSGLTSGLTGKVTDVTGGVGSKVTNLTSSLGKGAGDVADQVSGTVSGALSSVKGGLEQVRGNLDQASAGVSSTVGQAVGQLTDTTKSVTSAVSDTISSGQAAVQQTFDSVNAQVSAVATQVSTAVDSTTSQVLDSLPPPVKEAALAVGGAVAAVAHAAAEHPQATVVVTAAVAVPSAIRYYKSKYGGYAGEINPLKVAELLSSDEPVFLIDIRPESTREQEGLPELRLGARFKVAAFALQTGLVPKRVAREAANADELNLLINAAYIAGLPQCQGNLTKLVIMDSTGSDKARELARALVTLGYGLSFVMEGGFRAWVEAELPVLEETVEYDASTGAVISDNIEVVASKASEVATTLAQPQVGLPLIGGSILGGYAVYNYHTTLQYIGVLSVLFTVTNKLLSYDSPGAFFDDVKNSSSNVAKAVTNLKLPSAPRLPSVPKLPGLPGRAAAAAVPAAAAGYGGAAGLRAQQEEQEEESEQAGQQEAEVVEQQ